MPEAVRLIIWDLDETFWRGTLTEGGIEFVPENKAILIELSARGIISSICSKNDPEHVKRILLENGVWDYFVLPSISWEPKGPRIQALIETFGLRPPTVMFIDDNPLNLEEARNFSPGIQINSQLYIGNILQDPLFRGKNDKDNTRLKQYKALERRKSDQVAAKSDVTQFLRDSEIQVIFDFDVEKNVDRFIELVNRTNQLNFTKNRLSEDIDEARKQVLTIARSPAHQTALIRVRDRYGDHGYCGVYVHNSEVRRLDHFAFSCRILGMGIERWLYQKLERPRIHIQGEVLADLADNSPVDWVKRANVEQENVNKGEAPRLGRITARGSCDIGAVVHYFRFNSDDTVGEYHIPRNGGVFRIDHSIFLRYISGKLPSQQLKAAGALGYIESDFHSRLYNHEEGGERQVVILSFGADVTRALYRHRDSGLVVPSTVVVHPMSSDVRQYSESQLPGNMAPWALSALATLRDEWDYLGITKPDQFAANLSFAVERISCTADIYILKFFDRSYVTSDGKTRPTATEWLPYNAAIDEIAKMNNNVFAVDVNTIVDEEFEITDRLHFERRALFKIYQSIHLQIFSPTLPRAAAAE